MTEPLVALLIAIALVVALLIAIALVGGYCLRVVGERVEALRPRARHSTGCNEHCHCHGDTHYLDNALAFTSGTWASDNLDVVTLTHGDGIPPRD